MPSHVAHSVVCSRRSSSRRPRCCRPCLIFGSGTASRVGSLQTATLIVSMRIYGRMVPGIVAAAIVLFPLKDYPAWVVLEGNLGSVAPPARGRGLYRELASGDYYANAFISACPAVAGEALPPTPPRGLTEEVSDFGYSWYLIGLDVPTHNQRGTGASAYDALLRHELGSGQGAGS